MNKHLVKKAIKKFITDHESELVNGLTAGGSDKRIGTITTSRFTPFKHPISIGIECTDWTESYDATMLGSSIAYDKLTDENPNTVYTIELHVGDFAQVRTGEVDMGDVEPYETDTETFETFLSRLVRLFRKYTTIPPVSGNWRIEVYGDGSKTDRRIDGRDQSVRFSDGGKVYAALYEVITFKVQTCGEPDPLA